MNCDEGDEAPPTEAEDGGGTPLPMAANSKTERVEEMAAGAAGGGVVGGEDCTCDRRGRVLASN